MIKKKERNICLKMTTKVSTRKANFVLLTDDPIKSMDHKCLKRRHTRVGQKQPLGQRRQEAFHGPQRAIHRMLQGVLEVH